MSFRVTELINGEWVSTTVGYDRDESADEYVDDDHWFGERED